jgi:hypothetical protein
VPLFVVSLQVSDQHAEAVARRALVLRLCRGEAFLPGGIPFWLADSGIWNPDVRLVLYTSKEPCGSSRALVDEGCNQRLLVDRHVAIRKPGHGPASLCRSCSDKITKWAAVDLMGSTGHRALGPGREAPKLHCLVVGGQFEHEALFREMVQHRSPQLVIARTLERFPGDAQV